MGKTANSLVSPRRQQLTPLPCGGPARLDPSLELKGDPPCSFPPWPRRAAGSDRFWLLELRVSRAFSRPVAAPAFRPWIPSSARGIDSGPRRFTEIVLNMTNMNGSRTIAGLRSDAGRRAPSAAPFIQGLGVIVGRVGIPGADAARLRPPDLGTGRVEGRTSYLLAEMRFGRSSSERTR